MARRAARRFRAMGGFKPRPAALAAGDFCGGTSTGDEGADPTTPRAERRSPRRFVATTLVCFLCLFAHGAAGRLRARRSARPSSGKECELECEWECELERLDVPTAPPRRKQQGRRSYVRMSFIYSESSPRRRGPIFKGRGYGCSPESHPDVAKR